MKTAIVHDSLWEFGGAERVLRGILAAFPHADIYTAFAHPSFCKTYLPTVLPHKFHVSFLQPFRLQHRNSLVQALAPLIWRSFDLSSYDLVISSSLHIMSSLVRVPNGVHIQSLQYPPKNIFGIDPQTPLQRITRYDAYIRPLYLQSLKTSRHVIVNSKFTQKRLLTHLGIPSTVIYPPVVLPRTIPKKPRGAFYLCVSRIVPSKNLELAVIAATKLHVPLKIFGVSYSQSYKRYIQSLAGPTVEFLPFRTDFRQYYTRTIAFIFPTQYEDFGIAPLEATAHTVPVIAFYGGGAKETVIEGKTGTFFHTHTADSLMRAMKRLRTMRFDPQVMRAHVTQFGTERFIREFRQYAACALNEKHAKQSINP